MARTIQFLLENARWLGAGALLMSMSSFGQTFFISIFAGQIQSKFGLSHGEWGGIYALGTTAAALLWFGPVFLRISTAPARWGSYFF